MLISPSTTVRNKPVDDAGRSALLRVRLAALAAADATARDRSNARALKSDAISALRAFVEQRVDQLIVDALTKEGAASGRATND